MCVCVCVFLSQLDSLLETACEAGSTRVVRLLTTEYPELVESGTKSSDGEDDQDDRVSVCQGEDKNRE